jgi:hypothetical protein
VFNERYIEVAKAIKKIGEVDEGEVVEIKGKKPILLFGLDIVSWKVELYRSRYVLNHLLLTCT